MVETEGGHLGTRPEREIPAQSCCCCCCDEQCSEAVQKLTPARNNGFKRR
jgi:transposase